jgi:hypothetical protein
LLLSHAYEDKDAQEGAIRPAHSIGSSSGRHAYQ